jgi:Protein of unknown function (DUF1572)
VTRARLEELEREFRSYRRTAERAMEQADDAAFFRALDTESNSVAILAQHMAGNLRSRFTDFLVSDGEKPDRHRDQEFEMTPGTSRADLMARWAAGWQILGEATAPLSDADLDRTVLIRGEPHTVHRALLRSLAHMALHTGQIIQLAKHWAGPAWVTLSIPRGQSEAYRPPGRPADRPTA